MFLRNLFELDYEVLPQPQFSSDLAPSDYYFIPNLKKWLQGKQFLSNKEEVGD